MFILCSYLQSLVIALVVVIKKQSKSCQNTATAGACTSIHIYGFYSAISDFETLISKAGGILFEYRHGNL